MAITETTDTTSVSGKMIKKFTTDLSTTTSQASDTCTWTCPGYVSSLRILMVAGGGSGGTYRGGGGGAGGMIDTTIDVIPGQQYTFTIGRGGAATVGTTYGYRGGNSTAFGLTALGGGGGARNSSSVISGQSGGCGGGGARGGAGGTGLQPSSESGGYGRNGGSGDGGGGGAGAIGGSLPTANGGIGKISDITGEEVYYAGGGGLGLTNDAQGTNAGGLGGGGRGGRSTPYYSPMPGTNGLGGGGGGAEYNSDAYSGAGGSGVVILQYTLPPILLRERQILTTGSGNLMVMEVQT